MGGFVRYRTTIEIEFDQLEISLPPLYCEIHGQRATACATDISNFCLHFPHYLEKGVRETSAFSTLSCCALPQLWKEELVQATVKARYQGKTPAVGKVIYQGFHASRS